MDIPVAGQAVAKHPVMLPAGISGNVIVPARRLLPPVVLNSLRPIQQAERAFPVQLLAGLAQQLGLGHEPERALETGAADAGLAAGPVTAHVYGKFRQMLIPAADFFDGLHPQPAA